MISIENFKKCKLAHIYNFLTVQTYWIVSEWMVSGWSYLILAMCGQAFFCWSFRASSVFRQMTHIPPKLIWETTGWIKTLLSYFDILFGNKGMKASFFLFLYIIAYTQGLKSTNNASYVFSKKQQRFQINVKSVTTWLHLICTAKMQHRILAMALNFLNR